MTDIVHNVTLVKYSNNSGELKQFEQAAELQRDEERKEEKLLRKLMSYSPMPDFKEGDTDVYYWI